jgi:hypothetical protein
MNLIQQVPSYNINIYIGLTHSDSGVTHDIGKLKEICQNYVNNIKLCVTVTPTEFIYVDGSESGAIVGLIHYPRYPSTPEKLKQHAIELGYELMHKLEQKRISIACPDVTLMLTNKHLI